MYARLASFVALCHVGEKIRGGGGVMTLYEGGVGWPWSGGGNYAMNCTWPGSVRGNSKFLLCLILIVRVIDKSYPIVTYKCHMPNNICELGADLWLI